MSYKSGVQVMIDPKEINIGVNSRWNPLNQETVEEYANSYAVFGQLTPCSVRQMGDGAVEMIVGHHRHAAMLLYNERNPDKPLKLKCIATTCNEEEALQRSIVENKCRLATTPMDDAFNQRRLREDFGWTNERIAGLYKCSESYVSKISKLLLLPGDIQQKIHRREMSVDTGMGLATLKPEEQKELLLSEESANPQSPPLFNGTPDVSDKTSRKPSIAEKVKNKVREQAIDKGKSKSRTLGEARKFFESIINPGTTEDKCSDKAVAISKLMLQFFDGKIKDLTMIRKMEELL